MISFVHCMPIFGQRISVRAEEPVKVSQAKNDEPWGFYQFPKIWRLEGGGLLVRWNMKADDISNYGRGQFSGMLSKDNGRSWAPISYLPKDYEGIKLTNGCKLDFTTQISFDTKKHAMPKTIGYGIETYSRNRMNFFRASALPREMRSIYVRKFCGNSWNKLKINLNDANIVKYSVGYSLPNLWWGQMMRKRDKKLAAIVYPSFYLENGYIRNGLSFYSISDNGLDWMLQSTIPYLIDAKYDSESRKESITLGFSEPTISEASNGDLVVVTRTTDGYGNRPLYLSRSTNGGQSWSKASSLPFVGVLPQLLTLGNGVMVLSTGRPGVRLYFSQDNGKTWGNETIVLDNKRNTCGYTNMIALGSNTFLLVYSDFEQLDNHGKKRKAIMSRKYTILK